MSEEAAQAFIERMKSDEDFRARVLAEEDVDPHCCLSLGFGTGRA